jgi:ATP-dependent helicase/nuclease subunit B
MRDLKDAKVDCNVALRAVDEAQFPAEDGEKLKGFFTLYAALQESRMALGVGSPDDLAALMTAFAPASPFLTGLTNLYYYGSYDLTQTQLDLLEALASTIAVSVYFPLDSRPAYGFARQFLERHIYPLLGRSNGGGLFEDHIHASHELKTNVSVEVRNAAGIDDELNLVCKQILSLVETNRYGFRDIGVVGRTLAPYQSALKRIFDAHRIPFVTSAMLSLMQEPVAKTLLHLAQLKGSGLYRLPMMDIITSPWNRRLVQPADAVEPRPDLWRVAVQALGIMRGEEEWRRLESLSRLDTSAPDSEEPSFDDFDRLSIDGPQLRLLWTVVSQLIEDVNRLPAEGGYGALTRAFLSLVSKHLTLSFETSAGSSTSDNAGDVIEGLDRVFAQLHELDRLAVQVTWDEWSETFRRILERATYSVTSGSQDGVQVLDAMAARGLGFRSLFLVGMNEQLFPRVIHEDGFLRDRHRQILSETLGYKVDHKLQGYEEEALLFELLRSSAQERLYLSYLRTDASGHQFAPSAYLDALEGRPHSTAVESIFALPRRWPDRRGLALFTSALLTREELAVNAVLQGQSVPKLLAAIGREGQLFSHGLQAQRTIESEQSTLNAFDGVLASPNSLWPFISRRGVSPTALESYARCPFQFLARQVFKLKSIRQMPSMDLSPPNMGQLCHDALRRCYLELIRLGWPDAPLSEEKLDQIAGRAAIKACAAYAKTHGTGYALTWQLAQELIQRLVTITLAFDREETASSGFRPQQCEIDALGMLPARKDDEAVPIRGRWDRVDRHPVSGALRVIDYKYRANGQMDGTHRQLLQAALRAFKLQPALYTLMKDAVSSEEADGPFPEQVDFLYLLPKGDPEIERASFAASAWQGAAGPLLRETLQALVDGVREGRHFIVPGTYCDHCEFSTACRRAHQPTWWRAYRSSQAERLRSLRSLKVPRE